MQGRGVIDISLGGFREGSRNLLLRFAEDDARLALALGLGLAGHGILQVLGDDDIPDLHGLYSHTPGCGALIDDLLQLLVQLAAADQDVGQHHAPDDVPQGRLRRPVHGSVVVLHFQSGFFRVPDNPEQDRVHIHRDRILGQRFLGGERADHDAVIDPRGDRVDDRDDPEQTRAAQTVELSQPQNDGFFPLRGHFQGVKHVGTHKNPENHPGSQQPVTKTVVTENSAEKSDYEAQAK